MSGRRDKKNEKSNKQLWKLCLRRSKQQYENSNPNRSNRVGAKEMKPDSRTFKSWTEGRPIAGKEEVKKAIECLALNDGCIYLEVNPAFLESSSSLVCLLDIYMYCSFNRLHPGFFLIRSDGNYFKLIKDEERIGEGIVNFILQSTLTDKNSLVRLERFMSNLLYVAEDVPGNISEEARKFLKTILELIGDTKNAAKNDYFSENFNITIARENNRRGVMFSRAKHLFNNDHSMMLGSVLGKKHLLRPIGFVMDEEKSTPAVFSVASTGSGESAGHFQSMLLKMLKRGPQEMLESFQSEATEHSDGGGKRIRLSKVTRAIRAKMRSKIEKEREYWKEASDDEC